MNKRLKMCNLAAKLTMLAGLLGCAGCMTYHVSPAKNLSKAEAVAKVNGLLDWIGSWNISDDAPLGAYDAGFSVIHQDGSESHQTYGYVSTFSYRAWGSSRTYRYGDIEEIQVQRRLSVFLIFCGLLDPTYDSCVVLNMRDGNRYRLVGCDHEKTFFRGCFPFYLFDSFAGDAHEAGEAFECLRVTSESLETRLKAQPSQK